MHKLHAAPSVQEKFSTLCNNVHCMNYIPAARKFFYIISDFQANGPTLLWI